MIPAYTGCVPAALTVIAETGDRYRSFGPYVPSINAAGEVAFFAELSTGESAVVRGDRCVVAGVVSHPDVNDAGQVCYYTERAVVRDGDVLAEVGERFTAIGPLGPTMNERGDVAFRAALSDGGHGVFVARGRDVHVVARTGGAIIGFEGLPVVTDRGQVVYRTSLHDGGHAIWADDTLLVDCHGRFRELGRFPCANARGAIAFNAVESSGDAGAFVMVDGGVHTLAGSHAGFASFRGALIADNGATAFYATPAGGTMGIYTAADQPLLAIGDSVRGSTVSAFVLNPVSVNRSGMLAVRLDLSDGRGVIARLHLPPPTRSEVPASAVGPGATG